MKNAEHHTKNTSDSIQLNLIKGNYQVSLVMIYQLIEESQILSIKNQNNHVECLYCLKRYLEALEVSKKYMELGNSSQEMIFLQGLIFYELEQYQLSIQIFSKKALWGIWLQKANLAEKISKGSFKKVQIGNNNIENLIFKDPKIEWNQTLKQIFLIIHLSNIPSHFLKILYLPHSIDISISNNKTIFYSESFELFSEIIPRFCQHKINNQFIEIKLEKLSESQWNSYLLIQEEKTNNLNMNYFNNEINNFDIPNSKQCIEKFKNNYFLNELK